MGAEAEQGYTLDGMTADIQSVGGRVNCLSQGRFTLVFKQVTHNWTEIILAFTFTVTVVLIFIL